MTDTLEIFGIEYTNVEGIIATDDNGDELVFTSGGGSSEDFIITIEYDDVNEVWKPDKTWAAIDQAWDDDKYIYTVLPNSYGNYYRVVGWYDSLGGRFSYIVDDKSGNTLKSTSYDLWSDNSVTVLQENEYIIPSLQNKTVTPTTLQQTVQADSGYDGLDTVTVNAMPSGTAGTPIATKGTVSNHSVNVTPSVTNTTGYITGSTKTGTAVTVSASELVSGSETKTENGTYDVTNLAELVVNVSGGSPTIQSLTVTPTTSQQVFNASGVDGYKPVTVAAMSTMTLPTSAASSATSGYTSKATIGRSTAAQYINIPPGYNSTGAYYVISAVANGSATAPSTISGTAASVSTGTNTLTLTKTISVTPTVSAGYVSSGTAGNASVTLTASVTTKAAATITPTTTNQTIAAGTYLTGIQTIAGDADLVGGNILSTANIFGVQGTVVVQNYYTGSSAPSSSLGSNGDLYLQI